MGGGDEDNMDDEDQRLNEDGDLTKLMQESATLELVRDCNCSLQTYRN